LTHATSDQGQLACVEHVETVGNGRMDLPAEFLYRDFLGIFAVRVGLLLLLLNLKHVVPLIVSIILAILAGLGVLIHIISHIIVEVERLSIPDPPLVPLLQLSGTPHDILLRFKLLYAFLFKFLFGLHLLGLFILFIQVKARLCLFFGRLRFLPVGNFKLG